MPWLDDIKEWCQKDIVNNPQERNKGVLSPVETGGKMFEGHQRAICPWIMMMMMN